MAEAYLTVVSNVNSGPPTVQAFWPDKTVVNCDWFLDGAAIASSSLDTVLVPTADGYYRATLTADDATTATTDESYVPAGFTVEFNFELINCNPVPNSAGASRYTDIAFDIVESNNNRSFPLSYVNFFVYQNGALVEGLTKYSPYVSSFELANGWHFVINGGSSEHRFKYNSNIIVVVTITT